ncbi:MAG: dihydropteroate synthase [Actinobacteria bacterium]|nr:dihydropteroate synthase [Actinomycetota bacterium]
MGIVNNTPDSFYDRGASFGIERTLRRARTLLTEGAQIIDVGGIRGGPGDDVSVGEEIARVVPIVAGIREADERALLSVDTWRAPVADAVLTAGADIVNDVTGAHDPEILAVVAAHDAAYVAMHHGGQPRSRPLRSSFLPDVTTAVVEHCRMLTERAIAAGVRRDRLIVDPGHDFGKNTYHSLELSRRLPELAALGFPVLVALSNKDFIGETLGVPLEERIDGSIAAAVFCALRGAHIVRVHEVARTGQALRMVEALLGWRFPAATVRGLE